MGKLLKFSIFIIISFTTHSCSRHQSFEFSGIQMMIPYRIIIGTHLSKKDVKNLSKDIETIFRLIDDTYNNWNPCSEISCINRREANTPLTLSKELFQFLEKVFEIYYLTNKKFDPTISSLKTLWLHYLKLGTLPPDHELNTLIQSIGLDTIKLDHQTQTLTKSFDNTQLDLCGISKGYAVDKLLEVCLKYSQSCYVEWGGEIKTAGKHPSQRSWQIAVMTTGNILSLFNQSIASSGGYLQYWFIENKCYTHIIDPQLYCPLEIHPLSIKAVSVIHPNCMMADAIATALMVFPNKQAALEWAEQHNISILINDNAAL